MTLALLHFLKVEALRLGSQIHHRAGLPMKSITGARRVLVTALLAALIVATPASVRSKLIDYP